MTSIISIENLSKDFRINHAKNQQFDTLRDVMTHQFRSWLQRIQHPLAPNKENVEVEKFWALKDVSFEVEQGERIGIIGRNGAGKSTLLKILSRIMAPRSGRVCIFGRVASLLEVGTGFHPELSGRENIYLNGAILGMTRAEIKRKFDEIVAFAEVEKFLDTPVKRYSSGMYVRLAFSVAAHLEPDILIVDEVLSVGDMAFQKKCLSKMEDVGKEGRTVLFVSHNMAAITTLCRRVVLLKAGVVAFDGPVSQGVLQYYSGGSSSPGFQDYRDQKCEFGNDDAVLLTTSVEDSAGEIKRELEIGESFRIVMKYRVRRDDREAVMVPNFHFFSAMGAYVFVTSPKNITACGAGEYVAFCVIPGQFLNEGAYFVGVALTAHFKDRFEVCFFAENALSVNIRDPMTDEVGRYGFAGPMPGVVRPSFDWEIERA